jgi:endonuclease III
MQTQINKTQKPQDSERTKLLVAQMIAYTKAIVKNTQPIKRKKYTAHTANGFLMAVIFDRNVKWEYAWASGRRFNKERGDENDPKKIWKEIIKMKGARLDKYLRFGNDGKAFHRYWKTFSRLLPDTAKRMLEFYDGDARQIWEGEKDPKVIEKKFDDLPLIGPALAKMAVMILVKDHGIIKGKKALRSVDVKPDIHVTRVFKRSGLVSAKANSNDVVQVARDWSPNDPSILDAAGWNIGLKWCHATGPECNICIISPFCLKITRIKK